MTSARVAAEGFGGIFAEANAVAEVFARWENDKDDFDISVRDLLARLIER